MGKHLFEVIWDCDCIRVCRKYTKHKHTKRRKHTQHLFCCKVPKMDTCYICSLQDGFCSTEQKVHVSVFNLHFGWLHLHVEWLNNVKPPLFSVFHLFLNISAAQKLWVHSETHQGPDWFQRRLGDAYFSWQNHRRNTEEKGHLTLFNHENYGYLLWVLLWDLYYYYIQHNE